MNGASWLYLLIWSFGIGLGLAIVFFAWRRIKIKSQRDKNNKAARAIMRLKYTDAREELFNMGFWDGFCFCFNAKLFGIDEAAMLVASILHGETYQTRYTQAAEYLLKVYNQKQVRRFLRRVRRQHKEEWLPLRQALQTIQDQATITAAKSVGKKERPIVYSSPTRNETRPVPPLQSPDSFLFEEMPPSSEPVEFGVEHSPFEVVRLTEEAILLGEENQPVVSGQVLADGASDVLSEDSLDALLAQFHAASQPLAITEPQPDAAGEQKPGQPGE